MTELLLAHAALTWFLTGLIWFVQGVHYRLFACVPVGFTAYHAAHVKRTGRLVAIPMLAEAVTAVLLLVWPPPGASIPALHVCALLLVPVWVSTLLSQIPAHRALSGGFSTDVHRRLVHTNWIRTAAWSGRALLLFWLLVDWTSSAA